MKTILPLLFLSAVAFATSTDNVSMTGKWHVHSSIAGNDSESDCTFEQKDANLSGTCTSSNGSVNITGKVEGKKITWSYKSEYNGSPLTVTHDGTLNGTDKISGTASVPEYSVDGDFTAIRSK